MDAFGNLKREPIVRRKPHSRVKSHVGPDFKDELLCELEWRQTISAEQIRSLENVRRELEESRDSFAAIYQQSPISYVTFNWRGFVTDANAAAIVMFGVDREKLSHLPFTFLVYREDIARFLSHLARCRSSDEPRVATQLRLRGKGQEPVRAEIISVPINASRASFLTAIVDLSERTRSERELAEAKEYSESIVETVSQPLVVLDAELRIVSVNRAFAEFFKVSAEYARGRVLDGLLNLWWSGNRLREEMEKILVKNQPLENFQLEVEPHNIGKRILLLNARRLFRKASSPPLILIAMEDITQRKQAEEKLRDLNAQLEARVVSRTQALQKSYEQMESFCYSIAHDLRAPLRSMTGFSALLVEMFGPQMGAEGQDYAARIQHSAERMDELIKDLLSYGRLNTTELPIEAVGLDKVFEDVVLQLEKDIRDKGAKICKKGRLPVVGGHRVVVHTVLSNLIANAIKFVAPGVRPKVIVSAEEKDSDVRVWVADNGIGIAPECRGRIFGVFQRLHSEERYPGTGIGLAIVLKGIERLGGRVGLESEPGKGSRFWFELRKHESARE